MLDRSLGHIGDPVPLDPAVIREQTEVGPDPVEPFAVGSR
jgi:hypothetical protein